ncbi:class II fructose-bisphosphate aldolase [Desulfocurvus sp. DL9XJH121]
MPHCPFDQILRIARRTRSAIACCSVYNLESIQGVIAAAEEKRAPVMLSVGNEAVEHSGLSALGRAAMRAAEESRIPALAHLNHGRSLDIVLQALDQGFKSVMFDGSRLAPEDNVLHTRYAVRLAHEAGAVIEGEIGPLPGVKNQDGPVMEDLLDRALSFVRETRVDILAVSVPQGGLADPKDVGRLAKALPVPLCIHRGSRLGPKGAALMASEGALKINFHTEIKVAMYRGLLEDTSDALTMNHNARAALAAMVREKIDDLGGTGSAA